MTGLPEQIRPDDARGVFGISVAAQLVGMGTQALRLYEARGLITPDRTAGGTRRYSVLDLARLRRIGELLAGGLNLAGVGLVLELETENAQLRAAKEEQRWLVTAPVRQSNPRPVGDHTAGPTEAPSPKR